jgi:DNA invertase Pin-like site-specific DNA recombinase
MKAIIVARVSTDEQKENSPDAQLFRMETYCKNKQFTDIIKFSFVESAYKTKRDEFDKIIETINSQKEKIAVCFDKVDRLSRNIFDKRVALLYEKAINNEIELHFVSIRNN